MSVRTVAMSCGLVGGICWVGHMLAGSAALELLGAVLLAAGVAAVGASLVREPWLQAVSALGAVALIGSLVELGRESADNATFEGVLGGLATLVVAGMVLSRPSHSGNH